MPQELTEERGPVWAEPRWWSVGYASRLVCAMIAASAVVGAVVGPSTLLISQLRAWLAGGVLSFPDWMYWQSAGMHVSLGVVLASVTSIFAVLLWPRPDEDSLVGRILSGPLVTGGLYVVAGLVFGGPQTLWHTSPAVAFACGVFLAAAFLFRLMRPSNGPHSTGTGMEPAPPATHP